MVRLGVRPSSQTKGVCGRADRASPRLQRPLGAEPSGRRPQTQRRPPAPPQRQARCPQEDQEIFGEGQRNRRGQVQEKTQPHPNDSRSPPPREGIHAQSHLFSPNSLLDSDPAEPQHPLQHGLLRN